MGDMRNSISYVTFQTNLFNSHEPNDTFAYKNFEITCSKHTMFVWNKKSPSQPNLLRYILLRLHDRHIVHVNLFKQ